jgi:hypothetical protein
MTQSKRRTSEATSGLDCVSSASDTYDCEKPK